MYRIYQMTSLFCLLFSSTINGEEEKRESVQKNWLQDRNDQTDIFAIPLDNSEEEEILEEQQLKKNQPYSRPQEQQSRPRK